MGASVVGHSRGLFGNPTLHQAGDEVLGYWCFSFPSYTPCLVFGLPRLGLVGSSCPSHPRPPGPRAEGDANERCAELTRRGGYISKLRGGDGSPRDRRCGGPLTSPAPRFRQRLPARPATPFKQTGGVGGWGSKARNCAGSVQGGSREGAGEEASPRASSFRSSKPILSNALYFGASAASPEKGVWAVALHGTALPHGGFASEGATSRWHLLRDGASCWESSAACERLNSWDGEEEGMLRGAFRRKSLAMLSCWTQNYPRRALCNGKPWGTGQPWISDAESP